MPAHGNLAQFLRANPSTKDNNKPHTHTRIGHKESKIAGGSFHVQKEQEEQFWSHYYDAVFVKKQMEYLTERQLTSGGPLLVDIDFRFAKTVTSRQHTFDDILELIQLYLDQLGEMYEIEDLEIPIYILEKPNINTNDDSLNKDGIHIIFGIQCDHIAQQMLREEIIAQIGTVWDHLPITNTWKDVFDDGISKGTTNWQMFGSRKPNNEAYQLTEYLVASYDEGDSAMGVERHKFIPSVQSVKSISARNDSFPSAVMTEQFQAKYNEKAGKAQKKRVPPGRRKLRLQETSIDSITTFDRLKSFCETALEDLPQHEYFIKEAHGYTMILPESYYGPGSYNNWIKVGMALKETSEKLFPTWVLFSAQSSAFSFSDIDDLRERWGRFDSNDNPVTHRSIMYWANKEDPERYELVRRETLDYYIMETIKAYTDWDLAQVLYMLYKDRYVCASIKHDIWYEYRNHRWHEIDSGVNLKVALSKEVSALYVAKVQELTHKSMGLSGDDPEQQKMQQSVRATVEIVSKVKNFTTKSNIIKEAKSVFYVSNFLNFLDTNPYLLCFNNGVVDFKTKEFRDGRPEDYCSKSTNIDYKPIEAIEPQRINEVKEFFKQLFPVESLRNYMWEHLASVLIGTNHNQAFNIYTGCGRNGKSRLVELMGKALGDYKGTVPITLITAKRNNIGSTSSEIVQLKGTRYAVMQEPSKDEKLNEGIMKEITGGDPLQGRALFKDSIVFIPQFKLVVCTNHLFEIGSNDDGTWRRIRVCEFMSKFTENPVHDDPSEPYQFPVDLALNEKFDSWKYALMALLVQIAFRTNGVVDVPDVVKARSDKYRQGQDHFAAFIAEKIVADPDGIVMKTPLHRVFKEWYIQQIGKSIPKGKELDEYFEKEFGKYNQGFHGIKLVADTEDMSGNLLFDD
jgi:P4 family phage/plasmid primase-like protien